MIVIMNDFDNSYDIINFIIETLNFVDNCSTSDIRCIAGLGKLLNEVIYVWTYLSII